MNGEESIRRILNLVRITAPTWGISDKALARVEVRLLSRSSRWRQAQRGFSPERPGEEAGRPGLLRCAADLPCCDWRATAPFSANSTERRSERMKPRNTG